MLWQVDRYLQEEPGPRGQMSRGRGRCGPWCSDRGAQAGVFGLFVHLPRELRTVDPISHQAWPEFP